MGARAHAGAPGQGRCTVTLAVCKACKGSVIWGETSAGKLMPVNAEPVADGNLRLMYGPGGGKVLIITGAPPEGSAEPRFMSHFATCPEAARYRREKKAKSQRAARERASAATVKR